MDDSFHYSVDLSSAQAKAEKIIDCVKRLRETYDLRRFEFTSHLRVAPTELPHSHPILTLNTNLYNPDEILCEYLHEQMHWYLDASGFAGAESALIAELKRRYPEAPIGFPEGAPDEYSTYLHLLVNWLELDSTSHFITRERVIEIAQRKHYYRWIYRTVVQDWDELRALFSAHTIVPIRRSNLT